MFKSFFLLASSLFLGSAFAHSGHDHSAWHAGLLHLLWVMPAVILFAALVRFFVKKKTNNLKK